MPYTTGMVTDTGTTARMPRSGEWVDVPVLIRDGHYCLCGDSHGVFPRCVGSAIPLKSEDAPTRIVGMTPSNHRRNRKPVDRAAEFFTLAKRRLPRAIPQATVDACDACGPFNDAFYYCEQHRSQAIRNVVLASRKSSGVISLHMMMAEKGYDIVS